VNPETFTAWITKYALTKGIFSTMVESCDASNKMVKDISNDEWKCWYYHGNDWHRTKEAAVKRANEMRNKKLASLKKSIERIKKLEFENSA